MDHSESYRIPAELREIEGKLARLQPKQDEELVRSVNGYARLLEESVPYPVTAANFHYFTRFVRRAQYRAGLFGGVVGILFGVVLGGLCVYIAMSQPSFQFDSERAMNQVARVSPVCAALVSADKENSSSLIARKLVHYRDSIAELSEETSLPVNLEFFDGAS